MTEANKKSLSYKIQKNPFLLVFIIIVFAVVLFGIVNITSTIQEKAKQNNETTTEIITESQTEQEPEVTEAIKSTELYGVKKYSTDIKSVTVQKEDNCIDLKVEFNDKEALLKANYAQNINDSQVVPVFCFYLSDATRVKCPGEVRILDGGKIAVYHLSVIDDFANAIALTDEVTVTLDNALDNPFNIYLQNKVDGTGKTLLGTYEKSEEDYSASVSENTAVFNITEGIKAVEVTKNDKFIWIDIYYNDVTSYTELNNDFITNFIRFGFDKDGASYKRDFIITEYDSLNMVRCKFDAYSLKGLTDEMGVGEINVSDLFSDYVISVWSSDYDKDTSLFTING